MTDLLELNPHCPWCKKHFGGGEFFDGHITTCGECGKEIVAVAYGYGLDGEPGFMQMEKVGCGIGKRPCDRAATRARWRRQGRR